MERKIKKLLLVTLVTALSISQLNILCQAKLKPGQFNKEMLKWIEPYKERDGIPDSWTWYPEYDIRKQSGILPDGARITNELDEHTEGVFYDQYWLNGAWRGGDARVFHSKDVGLTKDPLAYVGNFTNLSDHFYGVYNYKTLDNKFEGADGDIVYRQVSKEIELYTGKVKAFLCANIDVKADRVNRFEVFLVLYHGIRESIEFDFTDVYITEFNDFSYKNLEKALDKYSKVCFNYSAYLGSDYSTGWPFISKNLNEGRPEENLEKRSFFTSKISKVMGKSFNDAYVRPGLKILDKLEELYIDLN